jgi:hypothetical protein
LKNIITQSKEVFLHSVSSKERPKIQDFYMKNTEITLLARFHNDEKITLKNNTKGETHGYRPQTLIPHYFRSRPSIDGTVQ